MGIPAVGRPAKGNEVIVDIDGAKFNDITSVNLTESSNIVTQESIHEDWTISQYDTNSYNFSVSGYLSDTVLSVGQDVVWEMYFTEEQFGKFFGIGNVNSVSKSADNSTLVKYDISVTGGEASYYNRFHAIGGTIADLFVADDMTHIVIANATWDFDSDVKNRILINKDDDDFDYSSTTKTVIYINKYNDIVDYKGDTKTRIKFGEFDNTIDYNGDTKTKIKFGKSDNTMSYNGDNGGEIILGSGVYTFYGKYQTYILPSTSGSFVDISGKVRLGIISVTEDVDIKAYQGTGIIMDSTSRFWYNNDIVTRDIGRQESSWFRYLVS